MGAHHHPSGDHHSGHHHSGDHHSGDHPSHPAVMIQRLPHPVQHVHRVGSVAAFRWSVILNSGLSGLQLVIGLGFGSMALVGDAVHNLGDVAGLLLAWGAERLSTRPPNQRFTYGFGRSTQLASLLNAVLILMAASVVFVEGVQRLLQPVLLQSGPVAWAAVVGVGVNLLSARLFGDPHQHDLNRRSAVVHLLTDAAVSAGVLFSALVVGLTGWNRLDGFTAMAVGLAVAWSGWQLLRESLIVALDAVPLGLDLEVVSQALVGLPGVVEVHHLHVWAMSTSQNALTAHLSRHLSRRLGSTDDMQLLHQAKQCLAELGIAHSTLQLEPFRD
jgi:cobalt-zinc-cadmium efflux system protein